MYNIIVPVYYAQVYFMNRKYMMMPVYANYVRVDAQVDDVPTQIFCIDFHDESIHEKLNVDFVARFTLNMVKYTGDSRF